MLQGELFPAAVVLKPTIASSRGETYVAQCSWCGLLICADHGAKLGDCPACPSSRPEGYRQSWWRQDLPVGPFEAKPLEHPKCHTCGEPVEPEYSVVFRWWDDLRIHHPSCIQTFAVGTPLPKWAAEQGALPTS